MQSGLSALYMFMMQMVQLNDAAWKNMEQCLQYRTIPKKGRLVEEGKICRESVFVVQGSFRYFQTIDGIEITTFFSFENNWASAYTSFLQKKPSHITIEAMEDSTVYVLSYNDLQQLYQQHILFERFGRLMAEYLIACLEDRMYSLLLKTPEERYLQSLNDNPVYFERVPQHYIASYLGIVPESLSRIRKRVMQKPVS